MTIELWLLIASILLGIVHLIASSHLISWQRGYRWTAGNREENLPPLRGLANRVDQATTNFLETFPFFAAAVLLAHVTHHHSSLTSSVRICISGVESDISSPRQPVTACFVPCFAGMPLSSGLCFF